MLLNCAWSWLCASACPLSVVNLHSVTDLFLYGLGLGLGFWICRLYCVTTCDIGLILVYVCTAYCSPPISLLHSLAGLPSAFLLPSAKTQDTYSPVTCLSAISEQSAVTYLSDCVLQESTPVKIAGILHALRFSVTASHLLLCPSFTIIVCIKPS